MKVKHVYLVLCVLGIALPYWQLIPWLAAHGFDLAALLNELFSTRIGAFFGLDVIVSAVALIIFVVSEGIRNKVPALWLPIVSTVVVGVSLGLPMFLLIREVHRERVRAI